MPCPLTQTHMLVGVRPALPPLLLNEHPVATDDGR